MAVQGEGMAEQEAFITIADLYKAYRKAKSDAFYDKTHFNSLAFAQYEQRLERNLARLLSQLCEPQQGWATDLSFIGGYSYLPKSVELPEIAEARSIHFATLDPLRDWENICSQSKKRQRQRSGWSFGLPWTTKWSLHCG
jgi:hypothetical protein